jgi:hypothetical protein
LTCDAVALEIGGLAAFPTGFGLPPAGPFAFICEWPAEGIERQRARIDGGGLSISRQAQVL